MLFSNYRTQSDDVLRWSTTGEQKIKTFNDFEIPYCDVHGIYYDKTGRMALAPNRLANPDSTIDDEAVFSLLLFGAIIPPLSPWKDVRRLVPGNKYHKTEIVHTLALRHGLYSDYINREQQADLVVKILDEILKKEIGDGEDPALLFSGGVDSGLIASRLASLGYHDSLLINYSFGDEDPEAKLAQAMAEQLGLPYKRVQADHQTLDCLLEPGRIYPQPFGDFSTIATMDLAYAVIEQLGEDKRVILDGTGADSFGLSKKIQLWERVYQLPLFVRKTVSVLYKNLLWYREGKIEFVSRILGRSANMPVFSAVWAQNSLAGTFYNDQFGKSIYRMLQKWIDEWGGNETSQRAVSIDLALVGAIKAAQKAQPIFDSVGLKVVYPFLDNAMVPLALDAVTYWQMDEPKAPLKRALARHVPSEMVYRPKSGFESDREEIFFRDEFIGYLRSVVEPNGPIAHLLKEEPLLKACQLLTHKKKLPVATQNLLWTIVFTDRWYRTAF